MRRLGFNDNMSCNLESRTDIHQEGRDNMSHTYVWMMKLACQQKHHIRIVEVAHLET
jgi:hypothetical protein